MNYSFFKDKYQSSSGFVGSVYSDDDANDIVQDLEENNNFRMNRI